MKCRFCDAEAVEQSVTRAPVCDTHLKRILEELSKLVNKMAFMSDVMDDIDDITKGIE